MLFLKIANTTRNPDFNLNAAFFLFCFLPPQQGNTRREHQRTAVRPALPTLRMRRGPAAANRAGGGRRRTRDALWLQCPLHHRSHAKDPCQFQHQRNQQQRRVRSNERARARARLRGRLRARLRASVGGKSRRACCASGFVLSGGLARLAAVAAALLRLESQRCRRLLLQEPARLLWCCAAR